MNSSIDVPTIVPGKECDVMTPIILFVVHRSPEGTYHNSLLYRSGVLALPTRRTTTASLERKRSHTTYREIILSYSSLLSVPPSSTSPPAVYLPALPLFSLSVFSPLTPQPLPLPPLASGVGFTLFLQDALFSFRRPSPYFLP